MKSEKEINVNEINHQKEVVDNRLNAVIAMEDKAEQRWREVERREEDHTLQLKELKRRENELKIQIEHLQQREKHVRKKMYVRVFSGDLIADRSTIKKHCWICKNKS